jgi:hypothetical protein
MESLSAPAAVSLFCAALPGTPSGSRAGEIHALRPRHRPSRAANTAAATANTSTRRRRGPFDGPARPVTHTESGPAPIPSRLASPAMARSAGSIECRYPGAKTGDDLGKKARRGFRREANFVFETIEQNRIIEAKHHWARRVSRPLRFHPKWRQSA